MRAMRVVNGGGGYMGGRSPATTAGGTVPPFNTMQREIVISTSALGARRRFLWGVDTAVVRSALVTERRARAAG